jgi:hypothetical protein
MFEQIYPTSVIKTHDSYLSMFARTKDSSAQFGECRGHFESGNCLMEGRLSGIAARSYIVMVLPRSCKFNIDTLVEA